MEERRSGEKRKTNRPGTKRWFALLLSLVVAVTMMPVAAVAVGPIDATQPGSLKLIYKDTEKNTSLSGVKFDVYRVADDMTGYANYKLNDLFSGAGISVDNLDAEGWRGAAGQLDGYVKLNGIQPDASMTTDENGECSLSSLHPGLFLVVGDVKVVEQTANDLKYTPQSILVSIPSYTDEVTKADWNYDVVLNVKFNREEVDKPAISKRVVKVWEDKDGKRIDAPEGASITVQLLSNDRPCGDPVVLNAENNWTYTWTELPALAKYTLAEINAPANYDVSVDTQETSFIVTNKFNNELISIIGGEKKWDDSIKDRPESIKVKLLANGKETGDVVEVRPNENSLWLWSFRDKLKYDENGEEIEYSVTEEADGVYIPKVETMMGNPYDFTMTNLPSSDDKKMNLNVYKHWVGSDKGPEEIDVRLHSSVAGTEDQVVKLKSPEWQYTFENLDVKDADGKDITYTITEETTLDGYTTTYRKGNKTSALVEDKIAEAVKDATDGKVSLDASMVDPLLKEIPIDDLGKVTEEQFEKALKNRGISLSDDQASKLLTALKSISADELKEAKKATNGDAVEVAKDGKSVTVDASKVSSETAAEVVIANTSDTPSTEKKKISLNVHKTWSSTKGDKATVILKSSDPNATNQEKDLTKDNDWKATFADLDVTQSDGTVITYTITEKSLSGYTATYSVGTPEEATVISTVVSAVKAATGLTLTSAQVRQLLSFDLSSITEEQIKALAGSAKDVTVDATKLSALQTELAKLDASQLSQALKSLQNGAVKVEKGQITVDASKVTGDSAVNLVVTNTPTTPKTPDNPTTPTTPNNPTTPGTTGTTTNTKTTTTNTPKASEVTTKLPQTGMLWWPVPVCAAAGILFFTIGWALRQREERRIESGK